MALLLWLAFALPQNTDAVTVVTIDGPPLAAQAVEIKSDTKGMTAVCTLAGGATREIPCEDVVEIRFGPAGEFPAAEDASVVAVELTTGDRVVGRLAGEMEKGAVPVQSESLGRVAVSSINLAKLTVLANRARVEDKVPDGCRPDAIVFSSGDHDGGTFVSVSPQKLTYKSKRFEGKEQSPGLDQIAFVVLALIGKPPSEAGAPLAVMDFADASLMRGRDVTLKGGAVSWTDLWKEKHTASAAGLRSITFKNGRIVYVSDLTPIKADETATYIRTNEKPVVGDRPYPWQRDRNVLGGPISVRGRAHRKGLGVHAYSSLTYDLGGPFSRFAATAAIDDCAGERGNAVFEVYADDKKIYASGAVKGSEPGREIDLDVRGVKTLRLVVDFGEDMGVCDRADWASARLIR